MYEEINKINGARGFIYKVVRELGGFGCVLIFECKCPKVHFNFINLLHEGSS